MPSASTIDISQINNTEERNKMERNQNLENLININLQNNGRIILFE